MKPLNVACFTVCLFGLSPAASMRAAEIRIPSPATGGSVVGSATPFLVGGTNTERYQQVYSASDFTALPAEGGTINRLGFVLAPSSDPIPSGSYVRDIEIRLSTTQRAVDSLSPVFPDNVGINEMIVFARGRMDLQPNVQAGAWIVPFTLPFPYAPTAGNLLLDVRVYQGLAFASGPPPPPFSFEFAGLLNPGDTVSQASAHDVNASTAAFVNTYGLFTYFYATPVPEPSTWVLLSIGTIFVIYTCRRFRRGSAKITPWRHVIARRIPRPPAIASAPEARCG